MWLLPAILIGGLILSIVVAIFNSGPPVDRIDLDIWEMWDD